MSVTVNLTWTPPIVTGSAGAPESFNVYRDSVAVGSGITTTTNAAGVVTAEYSDIGLPDADASTPVVYSYTVSASNAAGEGAQSSAATITV